MDKEIIVVKPNYLVKVTFKFEDGTEAVIENPKAAAIFQSRINTLGLWTGIEDCVIPREKKRRKKKHVKSK